MKFLLSISCFMWLSFSLNAQPVFDTILHRYKIWVVAHDTASEKSVNDWVTAIDANGQWKDIDYENQFSSAWVTTQHLLRLRSLACYYFKNKNMENSKALMNAIHMGTDHWLQKKYVNKNWWYNEIGVPQYWRDILIVAWDALEERQRLGGLALLQKYTVRPNFTGANLAWSADLMLHDGLITKNAVKVQKAAKLLANEIKITNGEAIQPDYSFLQHGKRLQTHSYGASFLTENMRIAWELRGTAYSFSKKEINTLTGFILHGWQWMSRGIHNTPATIDRAVSRKGNLQYADLRTYLPWFIQVAGEYKKDLLAMQQTQEGSVTKLSGFRYFPYADFAAYQQKDVSFFLKTISQRTEPAESINKENLQGQLLNFGNTYFVRNGNEYYDLMSVWDWKKLPGETVWKEFSRPLKSHFTGSVSNGTAGFSVMDVKAADSLQKKNVNKFWAFCDGKMICLIAGLSKYDSAATILDQCRLQGKVTVNEQGQFLPDGSNQLRNVQWVHHAGLAYIPLGENEMEIQLKAATGSWSLINAAGSPDIINEDVFMPVLYHYVDSASAYMVAGATTPTAADNISKHVGFKIIKNTQTVQAILFNKGDWMVVFRYPNMSLQIGKNKISANKPCLLMYDGGKIYVSDPLHNGGLLKVQINHTEKEIEMPPNGTTVSFKP